MPTIFTWNMNKGSCVRKDLDDKLSAVVAPLRLALLQKLCALCDFGFITEPGQDLRDAVSTKSTKDLGRIAKGGQWHCDTRTDNQSEKDACRPILYLKSSQKIADLALSTKSGGEDAFRYPAAALVPFGGKRVVAFVSLHATSGSKGSNGRKNTGQILGELLDALKAGECDGFVLGGDFNAHLTGHGVSMPLSATHQGDKVLDGFCFGTVPGFAINVPNPTPLHKMQEFSGRFRLVAQDKNRSNILPGFQVAIATSSQRSTRSRPTGQGEQWVRLSDHAPVISQLTIGPASRASSGSRDAMEEDEGDGQGDGPGDGPGDITMTDKD